MGVQESLKEWFWRFVLARRVSTHHSTLAPTQPMPMLRCCSSQDVVRITIDLTTGDPICPLENVNTCTQDGRPVHCGQ